MLKLANAATLPPMKLKATLMRWSPGRTPKMVGVVELVPLELVLELDPPPPQADKMRDAVIQKNTLLLNLLFMREPFKFRPRRL